MIVLQGDEESTLQSAIMAAAETNMQSVGYEEEKQRVLHADEALKMLFKSDAKALVLFVNSVFKNNYHIDAKVVMEAADFVDSETYDVIIGDMFFTVDGDKYHFEFQTLYDDTMTIRMFEYGTKKSLSDAKAASSTRKIGEPIIFTLPCPLVIFLEEHKKIKETMKSVIRVQGYAGQIVERRITS
jgi:hypothetical protein